MTTIFYCCWMVFSAKWNIFLAWYYFGNIGSISDELHRFTPTRPTNTIATEYKTLYNTKKQRRVLNYGVNGVWLISSKTKGKNLNYSLSTAPICLVLCWWVVRLCLKGTFYFVCFYLIYQTNKSWFRLIWWCWFSV